MINLREILMKAFKDAIGNLPDYKIRLNAIGYYEKGILKEGDIAELDSMIDAKNAPVTESLEPEPSEDIDGHSEEIQAEEVTADEE